MNRRGWIGTGGAMMLTLASNRLCAATGRPTIGVITPSPGGITERPVVARGGLASQQPSLAADLALNRPDIVIAATNYSIEAVVRAMPMVPVVMAGALDPVARGWVASLREPGGRITGTAWSQDVTVTGKYAELLAEVVPGLKRIGGLID